MLTVHDEGGDHITVDLAGRNWTGQVLVAHSFTIEVPPTAGPDPGTDGRRPSAADLAAAIAGSIGIAPAANLNPDREFPSRFEPVHGSAPDIAGRGVANPLGAIWSAALTLDHLGEPDAARAVMTGIERALAGGAVRTPDLGGTAGTRELTAAVLAAIPA